MTTLDYTPPQIESPRETPWVETRAGGFFFLNALLAAPILMTLYPVAIRWVLRTTGVLDRPSRVLDPVPAVATHFLPVLGWLALPALILVFHSLGFTEKRWARRGLWLFALVHLGTLLYTISLVR